MVHLPSNSEEERIHREAHRRYPRLSPACSIVSGFPVSLEIAFTCVAGGFRVLDGFVEGVYRSRLSLAGTKWVPGWMNARNYRS